MTYSIRCTRVSLNGTPSVTYMRRGISRFEADRIVLDRADEAKQRGGRVIHVCPTIHARSVRLLQPDHFSLEQNLDVVRDLRRGL